MGTTIANLRNQVVFAKEETTAGTIVFPSATDMVLPAGDAVINQVPAFTNSEEKRNSLSILDQFQSARPPGTWSVPMYSRPSATLGNVPQGDILFYSLLGTKYATGTVTFALNGSIDDSVTSLVYETLDGGILPPVGVITIGTEQIYYGDITRSTSTTGTLSGCTRGYNSTTAASHLDEAAGSLTSLVYKPNTDSPAFSIWVKYDHAIFGMSGCTANNATFGANNEGAATWTFSGEGMLMVWAGTDAVQTEASSGASTVIVDNAKLFSTNTWIWNQTKNDSNSSSGYKITGVNTTTNTLTLASTLAVTWEVDDVISGYLPTGTEIGTPIESRYTTIEYDGVEGGVDFQSTDISLSCPKPYVNDILGDTYSDQFGVDTRNVSATLSAYFKKSDTAFFTDGFNGNEVPINLFVGASGSRRMVICGEKVQMTTPTITPNSPFVNLDMTGIYTGTDGEDEVWIVWI